MLANLIFMHPRRIAQEIDHIHNIVHEELYIIQKGMHP